MDAREELLLEIERLALEADPEERDPSVNEIWRLLVRARVTGVLTEPQL